MFSKILGAALAVFAILGAGSASASKPTQMSIATGVDPSYAAFYLAQTEGLFEKNGLKVDLRTGPSGSTMVGFLVKNAVQAAFGAEQAGMLNFMLDPDVVVAAEGTEVRELYGIVAKGVDSIDGLKGKKIGVSPGTGSEVFWLSAIKKLGLNAEDYRVVQVEAPEMIAALERGDIDAFSSWEPWVTRATMSIKGAKKILPQEGILDSRVFVYLNKGWAEKHPDAAVRFIRSLNEANELIAAQPDYAVDKVSKFLRLDRALTAKLMDQYSYGLKLTDASISNLKLVADQLQEAGKLAKPVDWETFVYATPLRAAAPNAVTYTP